MKKVLLVDNQNLFRDGIEAILRQTEGFEVAGAYADVEKAKEKIKEIADTLHVVLISMDLPNKSGISLIKFAKQHYPTVRVLALAETLEEHDVLDAITAGCDGFLMKRHYADTLLEALEKVAEGDTVFSGKVARMLAYRVISAVHHEKDILAAKLQRQGYRLTNREIDVAFYMMQGFTNKEIANKLELSEGTTKNYISELYNKLACTVRKEMVTYLRTIYKEA